MTLVGEAEGVLLGFARLLGLLKDVMVRCTLVRDRYRLSSDNTTVLVFLIVARLTAAHQDSFIPTIIICSAFVFAKFGSFPVLLIDEVGKISFEFERVQFP